MATPLEEVTGLFGDGAFLVPCIRGTKVPAVTYTQRPFEATQTPAYRYALASGEFNIAVYLGQMSGGLCALDFDQDEDLAAFLAANPPLAATTRSRGSRGGMIWLRLEGEFPASCNTPRFEWRGNGRLSTIYGQHPKGMEYAVLVAAPPVMVKFADIRWPDGWELPWVGAPEREAAAALAKEYGQPFYTNKEGRVTGINERYWAALYARENRVIYDPDEKTFYRYEPETGLWGPVTAESIREVISGRILEASRESRQFTLEIQITQTKLKAVVSALMGIVEKRGAFRAKSRFIHVANGVLRLGEDGDVTFGGYSPEDYSRNKSPFAFDGEAECPRFLNELIYPAVSAGDADLLQRWAGLALFGYNLPQRFLILDGTANGGKGTLVRVIQALVGLENTYQLRTECLNERFETYRYRNKTLLIGPDVSGDFLMQKGASMLKVLVGGDPISGEGKGLNGDFPMFGTFNIVMTCNSRLCIRLEDDAGAWRRRLLIVRYENPPPVKRILDFHVPLLREEGSGILRWALAGFVRLQAEFAEIGDFRLTDVQRGRIDSLLAESDSLRLFVKQRMARHEYGDVTTSEISQAYAEFCADNGWNVLPTAVVERTLPDIMLDVFHVTKSHSIERDGKKSNRGWRKVRLLEATDLPAEAGE
ncbi:MAG TPA: bifunctional DNA primase/polymerase [Candidatus Paceibacterota bacterium]|nr:bifunctional DNA primase/polymerase [Verrucomicrobiota bacterium]HSA12238.1 bifunctional DNA primase/polymerase [Candidatus Paceibacterota bacterium]